MTAKLTTLKDRSNNTLYPLTKTNAVSDSNGTSLDSIISDLQQKDTVPTENSTNPVTSGGVYNALAGKVSKISFSRWMRWEQSNQAQSGTQTCSFTSIFGGTSGNLADNEFISSVTIQSVGGAYSNNALVFMTGLTITDSQLTVSWWRPSNDNNNLLRIFAIVYKYEYV